MLSLAYRMMGTLTEAEDVVQETYVRWYRQSEDDRAAIRNPAAWLTRVASRVALDALTSARARRERYIGEWLPEPVPADLFLGTAPGSGSDGTMDPADRVTLDESVGTALLTVLEAMTPAERVSFILHEVFALPFPEIAEIVGRTPAAGRQLASSAPRPGPSPWRPLSTTRPSARSWPPPAPAISRRWCGCWLPMSSCVRTAAGWSARPGTRCWAPTGSPGSCWA